MEMAITRQTNRCFKAASFSKIIPDESIAVQIKRKTPANSGGFVELFLYHLNAWFISRLKTVLLSMSWLSQKARTFESELRIIIDGVVESLRFRM